MSLYAGIAGARFKKVNYFSKLVVVFLARILLHVMNCMKRMVTGILFFLYLLMAEGNLYAQALNETPPAPEEQKEVALLIEDLKSSYNGHLERAIEKLGRMGLDRQRAGGSSPYLEAAVPELSNLMENWEKHWKRSGWPIMASIAKTIAQIGGAQARAALKKGLDIPHYQIRRAAMKGLVLISVENLKDKAPLLDEFLKDNNNYLRGLIGDRDYRIRRDIAVVVGHFADQADPASLRALINIVKIKLVDKIPRARQSAALALGYMGRRAVEAEIFNLILASRDYREDELESFCPVARAAIWALGEAGAGRPDAVDALLAALRKRTETFFLRIEAALALKKMGVATDEVFSALRETAVGDPEPLVSGYAIDALYHIAIAHDRYLDRVTAIFIKILNEVDDAYIRFQLLTRLDWMGIKVSEDAPHRSLKKK